MKDDRSPLNRPEFSPDMTWDEFHVHYWYFEELKIICSRYGIAKTGGKTDLVERIKIFLTTGEVVAANNKRKKRGKRTGAPLTLETKIIPEGLRFNQEVRRFFADYFKVEKFKFIQEMVVAVREAEDSGDIDLSLGDLVKIYETHLALMKAGKPRAAAARKEAKTYQWNNFLKAFHACHDTKKYNNKHKIAAFIWGKIRTRPGDKLFSADLLLEFADDAARISGGNSGEE